MEVEEGEEGEYPGAPEEDRQEEAHPEEDHPEEEPLPRHLQLHQRQQEGMGTCMELPQRCSLETTK